MTEVARVRRELPSIYSRELMELIFRHPYARIQFLEQAGLGNRQTASRHLRALAEIGLLQPDKRGRETYYLNRPFIDLIER